MDDLFLALQSEDPEIQYSASGKIAKMGKNAIPSLISLLDCPNMVTRIRVIHLLEDIGLDESVKSALQKAAEKEQDETVKNLILKVLKKADRFKEWKKRILGEGMKETRLPILHLFLIGVGLFILGRILKIVLMDDYITDFSKTQRLLYILHPLNLSNVWFAGYFVLLLGYLFHKLISKCGISRLVTRLVLLFCLSYSLLWIQSKLYVVRFYDFGELIHCEEFFNFLESLSNTLVYPIQYLERLIHEVLNFFSIPTTSFFIPALFMVLVYDLYTTFLPAQERKSEEYKLPKASKASVKYYLLIYLVFNILEVLCSLPIRNDELLLLSFQPRTVGSDFFLYALLASLCYLIAFIPILILLAKVWNFLKTEPNCISPGKAIGFLFIPIFNIFWLFYMLYSLSKTYNKYRDRYSLPIQAMSKFILFSFALWSISMMIASPAVFYPIRIVFGISFIVHMNNCIKSLSLHANALQ
ncbi:MAG: HEAT repeat domain-containing protein [Candidatus Brocadiae bacterium]|nr:HEAT repeat domain-containing protein [Candidatus Brocadiia bacterium]